MELTTSSVIREQLTHRRDKLNDAITATGRRTELANLLSEVDAALARLDTSTYGRCEVCHDPIEPDRLMADPLVRFCLDHLSPDEQRSLEQDLELAARIQRGLLPDRHLRIDGWTLAYHYQPARVVSGDYCDIIPSEGGGFHFLLGDVSGKGVAASMLMSNLHAMFRTLVSLQMPLPALMERASRVFCESTLPTHYATLVCGRAAPGGEVEFCNAGHLPPIVRGRTGATVLASSALPLGMFCSEQFGVQRLRLDPGDTMIVFSDGLTDAENASGAEYGVERLTSFVREHASLLPADLIARCLREVTSHAGRARFDDDVTLLAIRAA
ncbi:MAG TPA: SpoIIE family protein phosphatase [Vicinamibacterales bacterium]|nr:SpoIIE family protein phosphatase [Vicinamibacterales bacterium]